MSSFIDMTGWVMSEHGVPDSKLTVIGPAEDYVTPQGKHQKQWERQCSCGKPITTAGVRIRCGKVKSCGCLRNKDKIIHPQHHVSDDGTYEIFLTFKGEEYWVDLEDVELVEQYCWSYNNNGYLQANPKDTLEYGKPIFLHRLLMGLKRGDSRIVDHIQHPKRGEPIIDHRKSNLRIVTDSQNSINSITKSTNTSGQRGVYYNQSNRGWVAEIHKDNKYYYLGTYQTKEEAIQVRLEKEKELYGKYAYNANN